MNLLVGDRDAWYPHSDQDFNRPVFVRPAVRRYNLAQGFDDVRARLSEWLEARFPLPEGGFRSALDIRAVRVVYRAVRRVWRRFTTWLYESFYGEADLDWRYGVGTIVALSLLGVIIALAW